MASPISSILLAGGKSSRLGRDKTRLEFRAGRTMIENTIQKLEMVSDEVIVVTDGRRCPHLEAKLMSDIYPGAGSLGGLYTGLLAAKSKHVLAVACDMPFLNFTLLRYMISLPRDYDVLIPELDHKREPLHAIYSRNCLQPIERLLKTGHFKILDLLDEVQVRYLSEGMIEKYDPDHCSFFNINTPDQLRKAQLIIPSLQFR